MRLNPRIVAILCLRVRPLSVDATHASGNKAEGPLPLGDDVMSGDLSTCPEEVDLLIVGAGLSGAVLAERCSKARLTSTPFHFIRPNPSSPPFTPHPH